MIGGDLSATHSAESGKAKGSGDRADKSSAGCAYTRYKRRTGIYIERSGETPPGLRDVNGSDRAAWQQGQRTVRSLITEYIRRKRYWLAKKRTHVRLFVVRSFVFKNAPVHAEQ